MTLAAQRILFTRLLGRLLVWTDESGLAIALDQVKRTQAEADANAITGAGIRNSLHRDGLAADFIAYKLQGGDWVPLTSGDEPDYALVGQQWERMDPLNCWGGRFAKPDPDHISSTRGGVR